MVSPRIIDFTIDVNIALTHLLMLSEQVGILPLQVGVAALYISDLVPHVVDDALQPLGLCHQMFHLAGILGLSGSHLLYLNKKCVSWLVVVQER